MRTQVWKKWKDKALLRKLEVAERANGVIILPIFTLSTVQAIFKAMLKDISTFLCVGSQAPSERYTALCLHPHFVLTAVFSIQRPQHELI